MYSAEKFLECSNHYLKLEVKQETIEEVQNISKEVAAIFSKWQESMPPQTKAVIIETQSHEPLTGLARDSHYYQGYSPSILTYGLSSPYCTTYANSDLLPETISSLGFTRYNKKLKSALSSWGITYNTADLECIIEERILSDIFEELEKDPSLSENQANVLANAIANKWGKFGLNIRLKKQFYL
jgi:hypothetical protein